MASTGEVDHYFLGVEIVDCVLDEARSCLFLAALARGGQFLVGLVLLIAVAADLRHL